MTVYAPTWMHVLYIHTPLAVYSTSSLFKQAISSGHYCLEEFGGTNVQVALAALELLAGLADLQTEDIGMWLVTCGTACVRSVINMYATCKYHCKFRNFWHIIRDLHTAWMTGACKYINKCNVITFALRSGSRLSDKIKWIVLKVLLSVNFQFLVDIAVTVGRIHGTITIFGSAYA